MTFEPNPRAERPVTEAGVRPLELIDVLLRRWRVTAGVPMAMAVLAAGVSLVIPPTFTGTTTFAPENDTQSVIPAGLAGLAGQFGFSLDGGSSESPQFYVALVKSRDIIESVLLSWFEDPRPDAQPGDSVQFLDLLRVPGDTQAERIFHAVRVRRSWVSVGADPQTSIVELNVRSRYAATAAAAANRFVHFIGEFNTVTRQSQARAQRVFTEDRVTAAEEELRQAEENLRTFEERNRRWEQSPELRFEQGWLMRRVTVAQEVYLTLRRENETARIQEVNDTPIITVLDVAIPPAQRSSPRRILMVIVSFVVGGTLGIFVAFLWEFLERMRLRGDEDLESIMRFLRLRPRTP